MHMLSPRNSGFREGVSQCLSEMYNGKVDKYVLIVFHYIAMVNNKTDFYILKNINYNI